MHIFSLSNVQYLHEHMQNERKNHKGKQATDSIAPKKTEPAIHF